MLCISIDAGKIQISSRWCKPLIRARLSKGVVSRKGAKPQSNAGTNFQHFALLREITIPNFWGDPSISLLFTKSFLAVVPDLRNNFFQAA